MIFGTTEKATASKIEAMTFSAGDKTGTAFLELAFVV